MRGPRPTSASTAISSSCRGNRLLIDAVQNCWDRAHRARMVTLRMRPKPVNSTREHLDVLEQDPRRRRARRRSTRIARIASAEAASSSRSSSATDCNSSDKR